MPKRRRLLNSPRKHSKLTPSKDAIESPNKPYLDREVRTARGRLMGALLEVLEAEDSEEEEENEPKQEEKTARNQHIATQSYVLKLFDRSVDLSQFNEDTPLYPICRAWIANQPKLNYNAFESKYEVPQPTEDSIELAGPVGEPVSRIPELLPEQLARNKDNIQLDTSEAAPPCAASLLAGHVARWGRVRRAWTAQAQRVEARYTAAQAALDKINLNPV